MVRVREKTFAELVRQIPSPNATLSVWHTHTTMLEFAGYARGGSTVLPGNMLDYRQRALPPFVLRRITEVVGRLDYAGFVELGLVLDNPEHPSALQFWWAVLDIGENGCLTEADVAAFVDAMHEHVRTSDEFEQFDPDALFVSNQENVAASNRCL